MPQKLETVLKHVEEISNYDNRQMIYDYHQYLFSRDTSINYQKDNVKLIYMFAKFLGESKKLYDSWISFLSGKIYSSNSKYIN